MTITPDLRLAVEQFQEGAATATVARRLGISIVTLSRRLRDAGLSIRAVRTGQTSTIARVYTVSDVVRLLGMTSHRAIVYWITQGWLRARRNHGGRITAKSRRARHWLITEFDLLDCLAVRETWLHYSVDSITDPDLRAEAERMRAEAGGHWMTLGDLGRKLGYSRTTCVHWRQAGLLATARLVRYQRAWYIWSADAETIDPATFPQGWSRSSTQG